MINERISLTSQDILEKDFKVDARGYRPQEVDKFLDIIIKDYAEYNNIIKKILKENKVLQEEIIALKNENRHLKELGNASNNSSNTAKISNLDIIKRISNLEKTVYGKNL